MTYFTTSMNLNDLQAFLINKVGDVNKDVCIVTNKREIILVIISYWKLEEELIKHPHFKKITPSQSDLIKIQMTLPSTAGNPALFS